jgi:two-component system, OmpR family, alkaline phosphatase synthesis response regulator PhoP
MAHILVVEDTRALAEALQYNLQLEGHTVEIAGDGVVALDRARQHPPDLLVLDLMLPRLDGYTVLECLRSEGFAAPVLILTARGEETDKVRGFRAGADQYMVKPFGLLELLERVRLLLRRWHPSGAPELEVLRLAEVEIHVAQRLVRRDGRPVHLSPKAFDLLLALTRRRGSVASRLELLQEVWGHRAAVLTRTVDAHVSELRRKLERNPAEPRIVLTVWKRGYRVNPALSANARETRDPPKESE